MHALDLQVDQSLSEVALFIFDVDLSVSNYALIHAVHFDIVIDHQVLRRFKFGRRDVVRNSLGFKLLRYHNFVADLREGVVGVIRVYIQVALEFPVVELQIESILHGHVE